MTPIYAVGDIHGQKDMLDHALALIEADAGPEARIVFLGDYTDRGPDSRGVIETLIEGRDLGRDWVFLQGNHDRFFANYLRKGWEQDVRFPNGISWLNRRLGGAQTLASYNIVGQMHFAVHVEDTPEKLLHCETKDGRISPKALHLSAQNAVPRMHLDFLDALPLWHQTDDLLFVHAGLRPGVPLKQQDPNDLIWIRDGFLDSDHDFGRLVVHGHTALDQPQHFHNRIDLDGGAGYGNPLVPAVFEGRDCWLLTDKGRMPLVPLD